VPSLSRNTAQSLILFTIDLRLMVDQYGSVEKPPIKTILTDTLRE
jgi:hypothetical protein